MCWFVLFCSSVFIMVIFLFRSTIQTRPLWEKKSAELHPFRMQAQVSVAYWPAYQ